MQQEHVKRIRQLARRGKSRHEIAAELSLSYSVITHCCLANNIKTKRKYRKLKPPEQHHSAKPERNAAMLAFLAEGHTLAQAGKEYGITKQSVSKIMQGMGAARGLVGRPRNRSR